MEKSVVQKSKGVTIKRFLKDLFQRREVGVFLALVIIIVILSILSPHFLKFLNILNILRQISLIGIVGVGMTFCIVAGEFDLSVGSTMGLSAIVLSWLMKAGVNPWLAFIIIITLAVCIGIVNGLLVTKIGIPSFVATLGMLGILRGLALVIAGGWPIGGFEDSGFIFLTGGRILDTFPVQVVWMIVVMIVGGIVMSKTTFGHHVYGTGDNKQAARLAGVNTDRVKITVLILTAVTSAIAAALFVGFLGSASPLTGTGIEMDAIAAVIIGGTNLFGGAGFVIGTLFGAMIMGVIRNGMILTGVSVYWQETVIGLVIIGAVAIDMLLRKSYRKL